MKTWAFSISPSEPAAVIATGSPFRGAGSQRRRRSP